MEVMAAERTKNEEERHTKQILEMLLMMQGGFASKGRPISTAHEFGVYATAAAIGHHTDGSQQ
jgi:hypothetical protein